MLQKDPPALQREHLLLQNMKFLIFYMGDFCLPGSASMETQLNPDPLRIRIRNTARVFCIGNGIPAS